ncbi:MAG: LysM peptidoglycan-binding domain-containing protein [Planctomycetaceae bacterium]|nr:LysM peptidoglycan-binding domain-containing protein [Planctomycetaceae bacterium]
MADKSTAPLLIEPNGAGGIYIVQPGDSLTAIVNRHAQSTLAKPEEAIAQVMADNPHIQNANRIFPGQPIFLRSRSIWGKPFTPATDADIKSAMTTLLNNSSPELSALVRNSDAVGLSLGSAQNLSQQFKGLVKANQKALNDLILNHQNYRANGVSQSGYREFGKARTNVLLKMQNDFGRMAKPVLGGSPAEVTRLKPGRSANPTANLATSANRLAKVSKAMKAGGVILQVADVAVSLEVTRQKVCVADTRSLKNREFTSGLGSIAGGLGGSAVGAAIGTAVVTIALGSNPAGWAVLLIVAAGGAIGGYGGNKLGGAGAKKLYTEYGQGYDIVEATGVEALCP